MNNVQESIHHILHMVSGRCVVSGFICDSQCKKVGIPNGLKMGIGRNVVMPLNEVEVLVHGLCDHAYRSAEIFNAIAKKEQVAKICQRIEDLLDGKDGSVAVAVMAVMMRRCVDNSDDEPEMLMRAICASSRLITIDESGEVH